MLHEFALEPVALSNWQSFRYLVEKFGVPHGRMISRFPKKWKRMVYQACSKCGEIERKKIEEGLGTIDAKLIRTHRAYVDNMPWLDNAESQHKVRPFQAIIASSNPRSIAEVLIADELDETAPLWNVPREKPVSRKASVMAQTIAPLLSASSEILFVDPHFAPEMYRYQCTLREFLASAVNQNTRIRRVEYHLTAKPTREFFENVCKNQLCHPLPPGLEMTLIRWKNMSPGESLHPRYVLTDIGGVRFEHGLDEGKEGETTDVSLLDSSLYLQRWNDYQRGTSSFEYVDEVKVLGRF